MKDFNGKQLQVNDKVVYFGAIGSKVYPERGTILEVHENKIYFQPDATTDQNRRKKWLRDKAVVIRQDNAQIGGV